MTKGSIGRGTSFSHAKVMCGQAVVPKLKGSSASNHMALKRMQREVWMRGMM